MALVLDGLFSITRAILLFHFFFFHLGFFFLLLLLIIFTWPMWKVSQRKKNNIENHLNVLMKIWYEKEWFGERWKKKTTKEWMKKKVWYLHQFFLLCSNIHVRKSKFLIHRLRFMSSYLFTSHQNENQWTWEKKKHTKWSIIIITVTTRYLTKIATYSKCYFFILSCVCMFFLPCAPISVVETKEMDQNIWHRHLLGEYMMFE